jgi:hypothetical protein
MSMKLNVEQLRNLFEYDPVTGLVLSKSTGKQVGYLWTDKNASYMKVSVRVGTKVHQLQISRVAYSLMKGVTPPKSVVVTYINDDPTDLSWCNLKFTDKSVVASESAKRPPVRYVATNHPNVFKRVPHDDPTQSDGIHPASYVVRRWDMDVYGRQVGASKLAVLRFNNFEEAADVADEWCQQRELNSHLADKLQNA